MKKSFWAVLFLSLGLGVSAWAAGNFSLSGDELEFDMDTNLGEARGHVVLEQDEDRATANYAQFNNTNRTGYLEGNVVADKDGYHITGDTLTVHDADHTSIRGKALLTKDGRSLAAPYVEYFKEQGLIQTDKGRAKLKDADGSIVEADKITYNRADGVAVAEGAVRIKSDVRKLTASADKAFYRINSENANYLELVGNAVATQNGNTVRGNKLKLNNAKVAVADGRVSIDFYPEVKGGAAKVPAKKSGKELKKVYKSPINAERQEGQGEV